MFIERRYPQRVRAFSSASRNYLTIHIPLQGSAIYDGLYCGSRFELKLADETSGHGDYDFYQIELEGELKDGVYSWDIKSKQAKQEFKYLWDQLIRELMMQGHKLIKANKKAAGFSEWKPEECYIEQGGKIIRRYILTKSNSIVISEVKK